MKKNVILIIIILLCFVFSGCESVLIDNNEKIDIKYDIKMINHSESYLKNENIIIESFEDLQEKWVDDWDFSIKSFESFDFESKVLLFINYVCFDDVILEITEVLKVNDELIIDMYMSKSEDEKENIAIAFFLTLEKNAVEKIDKVSVIPNQYEYVKINIDYYRGGCMDRDITLIMIKNKKVFFNYSGIDMKTLKVYTGECVFNEDLQLKAYDTNGVYSRYIQSYILKSINYTLGSTISLDEISQYDYVTNEDETITLELDDIIYKFAKSKNYFNNYYLKSFETSKPIIGSTHSETIECLKILYNNDEKFEDYNFTVNVLEDGYYVVLNEYSIAG